MLRGLLVMAMCAALFPLAVPAQAAVATITALTGTPAPAGEVSTLTVTDVLPDAQRPRADRRVGTVVHLLLIRGGAVASDLVRRS